MRLHSRYLVGYLALLVLAVGFSLSLAGAGGDPEKPMPGEGKRPPMPVPIEDYGRWVEELRASKQPQLSYLDEFNVGRRDFTKLPVAPMEAFTRAAEPLDKMAATASVIAVVSVESISFQASGMADFPAARVVYRVEVAIKGSLQPGETFVNVVLGGPYQQPDGSELFMQIARTPVDRPGERLLLLLTEYYGDTLAPTGVGARFLIEDGQVQPNSYNPHSVALAGTGEAELVANIRGLLK